MHINRFIMMLCLLCSVSGQGAAQKLFGSVQDVVSALPQLSLLNQQLHTQLRNVSLFNCLQEPAFAGTVFAPLNAGLKPLYDAGGLSPALGDQQHVADIFSATVVTGEGLTLDKLQHGMRLATLNSHTVVISVIKTSEGTVYYANRAQITTANIAAGKAVVHLVSPLVAASEHQEVIDALLGFSQPSPTPTVLWQELTAAQAAADASTVGTSPGPQAYVGADSMDGSGVTGMTGPAEAVTTEPAEYWGPVAITHPDHGGDDVAVAYSYEQDFLPGDQAASNSGLGASGLNAANLLQEGVGLSQGLPAPEARSSATPATARGLLQTLMLPLLLAVLL